MDIHKNDDTIKSAFWKQLKQPAPAAIAKQRKIQKKKTPKGKAGSARVKRVGKRSADVLAGTLQKRLRAFAGHTLLIQHGELWCEACNHTIGSAVTAVKSHTPTEVPTHLHTAVNKPASIYSNRALLLFPDVGVWPAMGALLLPSPGPRENRGRRPGASSR